MRACPICRHDFADTQTVCPLDGAALGDPDGLSIMSPMIGKVLGSYRLIGVLGSGGMGTVFVAAHTRLDRYVAIKVIKQELREKRDVVNRFLEEARTVNRLEHPNIVESIDMVEDVVDGAYCIFELLRGPDLAAVLRTRRISLESVVHVGAQIADALSAVHAIGVVHRDLKPDNVILIDKDGRDDFVKLIDFGVAFGTAAYMAPEQAAGATVDGRADLYSLGVVLYEMATGRHPFPSRTDDEYTMRHADETAPPPSAIDRRVPAGLGAIILRCLAKSPSERFGSAQELAAALRAVELPATPTEPTPVDAPRRRRWPAIAGAAFVTAGIAAAILFVTTRSSPIGATAQAKPLPQAKPPEAKPLSQTPPIPREPQKSATPTTPVATDITVTFSSTPPGAQVFRNGETIPLGTTPFDMTFAASDQPMRVRYELPSYEAQATEVALDRSHDEAVELIARKVVKTAPIIKKPGTKVDGTKVETTSDVQREGVMDPFAK